MASLRRAVVWFPHNPVPARTGAHERCLSLLRSLRDLGWSSVLLSSDLALNPWTAASVEELSRSLVREVRIYRTPSWEWKTLWAARRWAYVRRTVGRPAIDSWAVVPPGLRTWARRQTESLVPDLLLSSYAQYDPVVPHFDFLSVQRVIDSIDVVSASMAMWSRISPCFRADGDLVTTDVADEVLTPEFLAVEQASLSAREVRLYDRYTDVLAISAAEADRIRGRTSRTRVHYVPMTARTSPRTSSFDGPAVFVGAPNPFNFQGLLWFARHVLPEVRRRAPDFELDAAGSTFAPWRPDPGVVLLGAVDDLDSLYGRAAFAICPLLAGTGEQVKIIDAMAHGLAVVATRQTAGSSPIVDGVNGYVVDSPREFAERTAELWNDRRRCRTLGDAARDTIASSYPPTRTTEELARVLEP
jgi:glycosyltransferase involved in cell wall biosynthesis